MTKAMALTGLALAAWLDTQGESAARAPMGYPPARREAVSDDYHGTSVADPYRWLEDSASAETGHWLAAQQRLLDAHLGPVAGRGWAERKLTALTSYDSYSIPIKAGGRYFFSKVDAGAGLDTRTLLVQRSGQAQGTSVWRDRHALEAGEQIGFFSPSPNGRYLAYGITRRGSRWVRVQVVDVDAGADLPDRIDQLYAVAPGASWTADGSGFYYTRFDATGIDAREATAGKPGIFFHAIGGVGDTLVPGVPAGPTTILTHRTTEDGRYLVISVREGGSTRNEIYCVSLAQPKPPLRLTPGADAAYTLLGNRGARLFFYTDRAAPRGRVLEIDASAPAPDRWRTVVPEGAEAIAALDQTGGGNALGLYGDRLVLNYLEDGRPVVRIFSVEGRLEHVVRQPAAGFIWGGFSGRQHDPEVFYSFLGLTDPSTISRLDVRTGRTSVFQQATVPFDRDSVVVEQVFYKSRDGTRVPMFVAHKKGLPRDGKAPALMYGYGGLGWVSFIWYQPHVLAWLELGGVYAQPSLRGGGEYGEAWHQAGMKTRKQNTVDDYIAAAEFLIANRYTSPARLVANGGSLSGPLAGTAALVQRRDLFAAAVIDRPVLDLIRFDKFSGGGYWRPEFGSSDDALEFRTLLAQSPYHNVQSPQCYPATLVMSGDRDQTAVPLHAYKFTAALQAAQRCDKPVLLKVMPDAGHNFGNTPQQVVNSFTAELSFLMTVLKIETPR